MTKEKVVHKSSNEKNIGKIKPAIAGLPMDEASDAWMNDEVGTMDFESDNESTEAGQKNNSCDRKSQPDLQEIVDVIKPQASGLPMTEASDAWMNDDVGTIDLDSEDEIDIKQKCIETKESKPFAHPEVIKERLLTTKEMVKDDNSKLEEMTEEMKPAITGLPMDDASDAWMNDDVGTIESDLDDEEEKTGFCKSEMAENQQDLNERTDERKSKIPGLPMNDASDAWMNDDLGTIDSDSDSDKEIEKSKIRPPDIKVTESKPAAHPVEIKDSPPFCEENIKDAITGLPMDDASDAWMNDDVGTMDSDSDEESKETCEKEMKESVPDLKERSDEVKSQVHGLPMADTSDAWMNDDVGTIDSDSDEEIDFKSEDRDSKIEETKKDIKPLNTGLPMNEASDAWMDDDFGTINSDSENESKDEKKNSGSGQIEVGKIEPNLKEKTAAVKSQIAGLPMEDASDAWMNDDVGTIDSDSDQDSDDDKNKKETNSNVEQKIQNIKPLLAGLPMEDASDAWMNDDVGTISSNSDDEFEEEQVVEPEQKVEKSHSEIKPAIAGLPMENASDAWMDDDVGTMESDSNCDSEDLKESSVLKKEQVTSIPSGLPMTDISDAWMDDDFGTIDSDHEEDYEQSISDEKKIIEAKLEVFKEKLSGNSSKSGFAGLPCDDLSDAWMNDDFITVEETDNTSTPEYDENDRETQMYTVPQNMESGIVKEGRLSAIEEAKRFSCEEDEDEDKLIAGAEIIKEISVCDDDESTSWAYVASKEPAKIDEIPIEKSTLLSPSNPALIVEIIEKEPKQVSMDHDGYKVVKGKTKSKDKKKSNEVPESSIKAIIDQLDQPIDTKKHPILDSSACTEEFETISKVEDHDNIKIPTPEQCVVHQEESVHLSQEDDDPWLAVKEEYTRKDSTKTKQTDNMEDKDYTIEVKVVTKETCLGRRLHEQEEKEWKMDVKCMQKNTIPDIIEGHADQNLSMNEDKLVEKNDPKTTIPKEKSNTLPRLRPKAVSPERLCLSPSWMRKDFSRTQSVESNLESEGGIFGSVKERKFSDSRTSCFTSSAETLDDDDVYWRLKHKVKKKKRRNQSGPSDVKARENNELLLGSTHTIDSTSPVVNPIIEIKEESFSVSKTSINEMEEIPYESTRNKNVTKEQPNRKKSTSQNVAENEETISLIQNERDKDISVPIKSVTEYNMKVNTSVTMEEKHLVNAPKPEINIEDSKSGPTPTILLEHDTESKMVGATEIIRATSPMSNKKRPEFKRQNSKEMQNAVEVQRPICFEKQGTLAAEYLDDPWTDDSVGLVDDEEGINEETKRKSWSSIAATVVSKVSKTKNEKTSNKVSKHKTLIEQANEDLKADIHKDIDEQGFVKCSGKKEQRQKRKSQNFDGPDIQNKETEETQEISKKHSCSPNLIVKADNEISQEEKNAAMINIEARKSYAGLPTDTMTDAWMNDDVGSMDSDDEETNKPLALTAQSSTDVASKENVKDSKLEELSSSKEEVSNVDLVANDNSKNASHDNHLALTAPSWARIASKTPTSSKEITDLPKAPELVALKHSTSQTQIVDPNEEAVTDESFLDEEGFELSLSRKVKRERKISNRISLSIDEENIEEMEKKTESSKESKLSVSSLPLDDTCEAWMNDDFGTIESDSEDETNPLTEIIIKEPNVVQQQRPDTKFSVTGLPMNDSSDAWMDDDFGTIDSESEAELEDSQKNKSVIPSSTEEVNTCKQNEDNVSNSGKPAVIGLPMTDTSDAWMDDGILEIESKSENEGEKNSINAKDNENQLHKTNTKETGLPMNDASDAWMNDDVGTIDSDSEVELEESHISDQKENVIQQIKPLSLMAPSWAGIASKSPSSSKIPDLPNAPELVALKSSTSQTLIIESNEKAVVDDNELDEEGFEIAISRKSKRERKISKRISLSLDEGENNQDIKEIDNSAAIKSKSEDEMRSNIEQCKFDDTANFRYDMRAIEDAETKYFEFQSRYNKETETECVRERILNSLDEEDKDYKIKDDKENIGLPKESNRLIMNLSMDSFWVCKHIFDDAEEKYFSKKKENTAIIEDLNKNDKKDDEDDEDKDDKDDDDIRKNIKDNKRTRTHDSNRHNEDDEIMEYNWTDESTYLSPKIPVIKPVALKICTPTDHMQIECHLSTNAKRLSDTIESHINEQNKKIESNIGEDHAQSSRQNKDVDLMQSLKVKLNFELPPLY